ncbi:sigma factor [Streptomyces muensis]|uniref:RNA polymerase subunit sigma n=1 Tax=Streptomyces muensis TaxID=1077944 RepID=A0A9X1PXV5_STRM4|nr:sigma factor [Streptomyces muensis]MCF1593733.1 RNA polymerase subunit sigma [Streptomyces muensis]
MASADDAVPIAELLDERRYLLDVAYRMLGGGCEAEGVVAETYRRWFELPEAERARITAPRSWLTKVAEGICRSRLAPPVRDRAAQPGTGGPVPRCADPPDRACRLRRARSTSTERHDEVARAVRRACATEDEALLASLLAADATAVFDGGGKVRTLIEPVRGGPQVARSLLTLLARHPRTTLDTRPVNGRTGLVVRYDGQVAAVITLDVAAPHVAQVWVTLNPDKLRTWNRPGRRHPPRGGSVAQPQAITGTNGRAGTGT